jgi:hypothetical protein
MIDVLNDLPRDTEAEWLARFFAARPDAKSAWGRLDSFTAAPTPSRDRVPPYICDEDYSLALDFDARSTGARIGRNGGQSTHKISMSEEMVELAHRIPELIYEYEQQTGDRHPGKRERQW